MNQIELSPHRVGDKIEIILKYQTAVPNYKADTISLRPRPPFTPTRTSSSSLKRFGSQQLFDSIRDSMNQQASIQPLRTFRSNNFAIEDERDNDNFHLELEDFDEPEDQTKIARDMHQSSDI